MRFYPSYTFETPARPQQRLGSGSKTTWKGQGDSAGSVEIGVATSSSIFGSAVPVSLIHI